tara:strand:+ start:1414 stop:1569 length:156 start_codon:yes stop_codon:yes gene_type:complete
MTSRFLFILLVLSIIIFILGSIVLFSYLGVSFESNTIPVLKRAAMVVTNNS